MQLPGGARRWGVAVICVLFVAVAWRWWADWATSRLPLTVVNQMARPVTLTLYGEGVAERAYVASLAVGASMEFELQREDTGPLRLRVMHASADIDAQLVADISTLHGPQQLRLAPGNRYLLQPLMP